MEGNDGGGCNDDCSSSYVEMDFYESNLQENNETVSHGEACRLSFQFLVSSSHVDPNLYSDMYCFAGPHNTSSSLFISSSSNNRCCASQKSGKRWKRQHYLQQKAGQECLNSSRKWIGADDAQPLRKKILRTCEPENLDNPASKSCRKIVSDNASVDDDGKRVSSEDAKDDNLIDDDDNVELNIESQFNQEDFCNVENKDVKNACLYALENGPSELDEASSLEVSKCASNSKRHSDQDLDNPKPCKSRKPMGNSSQLSCKYSKFSFCGIEDHLPDGFYDAGRDRPFMPLESYERNQCLASREVILLDRFVIIITFIVIIIIIIIGGGGGSCCCCRCCLLMVF